ncbi:MAG: hypothetical protein LBF28_01175 [Rickettsiales bacterium]|jgi:hypothetical protein|nr:hypothetical protein [Rickettsiales bacterium]
MNLRLFLAVLCLMPGFVFAATERGGDARVGVMRVSQAANRGVIASKGIESDTETRAAHVADTAEPKPVKEPKTEAAPPPPLSNNSATTAAVEPAADSNCRDAYRDCMNEFCLLDESEGARCACSSNINQSKSLIQDIQKIQAEAEKLYTEGVEREQLGAQAKLVFGESEQARKSSRASGLSFAEWLSSDTNGNSLDADADIGDNLHDMASEYCAAKLKTCAASAEMEKTLYSRSIVQDCKNFNTYLSDQKREAENNKKIAESAVRKARLEMLDTTNKYNRGECLLAYRSCIADKGGCGANFENCLDAELLGRRANACENVLDQCMAVKNYVLQDWEAESKMVLADAAKYADKNRRATCFAKIQACLEDGCSTQSNSACLTNVNVAAGVCPIIDECNEIVPGIKASVNDKLAYLRTQFCQNDIDKCLQDKCGRNYTAPECLGKKTSEITAMCPQKMFPSCNGETQFKIIVQAALLQMDYQMLQGCVNYFSEQLGAVCGTDMSCLPNDATAETLMTIPDTEAGLADLRAKVREDSKTAVNEFFKKFEKDATVAACKDSKKPTGRASLGDTVFNTAKLIAEIGAENRALRQLETKIAEISRKQDLAAAEKNCRTTYEVEKPDKSSKNYSYIRSVSFEPSLRNCHVCRMQQVCETGGESKATSALKAAGGGLAAGASAGTMITPGWGTAIGGAVGAIGAGILGAASGGEQEFCQEIESCEDVNM